MKLSLTIHDRLDPCLEAALSPNADDPPEILDSRDLIPMPVVNRRSIALGLSDTTMRFERHMVPMGPVREIVGAPSAA